jgi:hypothetical protein
VARSFADASGVDTDPLLAGWVSRVGGAVAAQSPRKDITCRFVIAGTDTANAFTLPGATIFVTRGLLDSVDSDDELASVLAHEAGHVSQRHATKLLGTQIMVAVALSTLHSGRYQTLRDVLFYGNALRTLAQSRDYEKQADREGIRYAEEAGYDPRGLVRFFEGLGPSRETVLDQYLSTHPSPAKRVETARKDPLVARTDPAVREKLAAALAARGLPGAAARERAGEETLLLPPAPGLPAGLPTFVGEDRRFVVERSQETLRSLSRARRANRLGAGLQSLLLVNSNLGDWRWVYLASRAYAVYGRVGDVYARTVRTARTAPGTFDALARYEGMAEVAPAGSYTAVNASLGRAEVREAMARLDGVATPLTRAENACVAVLADLNNRFLTTTQTESWVRYGLLEGTLRYAESELGRADKKAGQAWRLLSMARVRRYEARLTELVPQDDPEVRALWFDLAQRRFGAAFPNAGPTGSATVRAALAVELSESAGAIEEGFADSGRTWADWVLEKKGIPENVATALRLLTLDIERETAARRERQPRLST